MKDVTFVPHTNWENKTSGAVTKTKEIPCLTGKGMPTTSTIGAVGCLYMDTDSGAVYKCTAASDGVYTWVDALDSAEMKRVIEAYLEANPPADGDDGGHYTPIVTQPTADTMKVEFAPSKAGMAAVEPVTVKLPSGGSDSGENSELDTTLTVEGKAADAKAVGDALKNLSVSGLTTAQINALDGMFKVAAYDDTKDVSGAYAAFRVAFGLSNTGGEEPDIPDEPDEPEIKTYTITNELVNVTSNNSAVSITEGTSYTATLTATDGYELDTVSVIMGGIDVTADVYTDGMISIVSVTGNVEIMASAVMVEIADSVLITEGLLGYWDFRNLTESEDASWHWAFPPNEGAGGLYMSCVGGTSGNSSYPTADEYGTKTNFHMMSDSTKYPAAANAATLGTEFTVIALSYGGVLSSEKSGGELGVMGNSLKGWIFQARYNTSDSSKTTPSLENGNDDPDDDYNLLVKRVSGTNMKVIMDTSFMEFVGTDYDGFVSWYDKVELARFYGNGNVTAFAVYNRALPDAEIEEMREFMKTLEVTA